MDHGKEQITRIKKYLKWIRTSHVRQKAIFNVNKEIYFYDWCGARYEIARSW